MKTTSSTVIGSTIMTLSWTRHQSENVIQPEQTEDDTLQASLQKPLTEVLLSNQLHVRQCACCERRRIGVHTFCRTLAVLASQVDGGLLLTGASFVLHLQAQKDVKSLIRLQWVIRLNTAGKLQRISADISHASLKYFESFRLRQ